MNRIKPIAREWLPYILILLIAIWGMNAWRTRDVPNLSPDWQAFTVNGESISLKSLREQHPNQTIALIFWAQWCPICRTEETSISNLVQDKNLVLIPIATQSGDATAVKKVLQERGLNWNAVVDVNGEIFSAYQLVGVPTFIVIQPDGSVGNVQTGYTSEVGMRLRMR